MTSQFLKPRYKSDYGRVSRSVSGYTPLKAGILAKKIRNTFTKIILHQEDKEHILHLTTPPSNNTVMFVTHSPNQHRHSNSKGNGPGHPKCDHCGALGHWKFTCYKLHGYPTNQQGPCQHSSSLDEQLLSSPMVYSVSSLPSSSTDSAIPSLSAEQY